MTDKHNVKFKEKQIGLEERFHACTSYALEELKILITSDTIRKYDKTYPIKKFKDLLYDHGLVDYSEHLFYYLFLKVKFDRSDTHPKNITGDAKYKQELKRKEHLIDTLERLYSKKKISEIKIYAPESFEVREKEIIDIIVSSAISSLWDTIVKERLNMVKLTGEESIEQINNQQDVEWIKTWMKSLGRIDPNYETFSLEKFDFYFDSLDFLDVIPDIKDQLRQSMITEYAHDHPIELPLSEESLKKIRENINGKIPGPGRKDETFGTKSIAFTLSCLFRVDRYFEEKGNKKISEIPLTNEDCRAIHDILVFFGLLMDYRTNAKNKANLEKRIRTMISSYHEQSDIRDIDEKFMALKYI